MNHLLNIVKKEVRELFTPATIVPIVIMALVFGGMGSMIGGAAEEAKEKPGIGIGKGAAEIVAYGTAVVVEYGSSE